MRIFALIAALGLCAPLAAQERSSQGSKPGESTTGLDMQAARAKMMTLRGQKVAYTKVFDLSGLPAYQPPGQIDGTIRFWGSNYITDGRLGGYWEEAFKRFHPGAKIEWNMKTTTAAVPSLVFGVSDIGMGRKVTFSELQLFQRYKNRDPLILAIATGSYDVPGWNPGFGVLVHKDNPLKQITMQQLDYIFGSERTGGWDGTDWHPEHARGRKKISAPGDSLASPANGRAR
jgi:phosphate transport system substrate-binding protein